MFSAISCAADYFAEALTVRLVPRVSCSLHTIGGKARVYSKLFTK